MAVLPATGSAISFGQVNRGFTWAPPGFGPAAPRGGKRIALSAILGNNATYGIGQAIGTTISFSATFGGKTTPYG
jgi:hypothetical protein